MSSNKALQLCDELLNLLDSSQSKQTTKEETKEECQSTARAKSIENQTYIEVKTKYSKGENVGRMPQLGFGTWLSKPGEVERAVRIALDVGYRHIDGAFVYQNEAEIGRALKDRVGDGPNQIPRKDVWITSKLWNTFHHPKLVIEACKLSLAAFQLDYLDLFLIHWPSYFAYEQNGKLVFPRNEDGTVRYGEHVKLEDTWRAMEELVELGLVKHIGVSNFTEKFIRDTILNECKIRPVVNQCECHPRLTSQPLIDYCRSENIIFQCYSPLGGYNRPWRSDENEKKLFEEELFVNLGKKYNKTAAQILLRYPIDRGVVCLSKSVTPHRIKSNAEIFDFKISESDMKLIDAFNTNTRFFPPKIKDQKTGEYYYRDRAHPYFAFPEELEKS